MVARSGRIFSTLAQEDPTWSAKDTALPGKVLRSDSSGTAERGERKRVSKAGKIKSPKSWPNGTPNSSQLEPSYKIKTCIGGWPNGTAKSIQLARNHSIIGLRPIEGRAGAEAITLKS